jgi:UPF0271 protein
MARAVALALAAGARIAAHPSYPDRARFGRERLAMDEAALRDTVRAQCAALRAAAEAAGARVALVKLHGALYHDAASDPILARAALDGALAGLCLRGSGPAGGIGVVGPPWGLLSDEARARGLGYAREGFADRAYTAEGRLVPRGVPGAVLTDPAACAAQAVRLAEAGGVDTLCVHGDSPGAAAVAAAVRGALAARGLLGASPSGGPCS